jgi:hypothetical protein
MSNQRPTRDSMSLEEATCLQHVGECGAGQGGNLVHLLFRSVSCVWLDERERHDRPAH